MTDDMMNLRALVEKSADAALLREMIGFAAQRLMELETEGLCGAGHGERSAERRNQRPFDRLRRLPRPAVGDARRSGRSAHSEAAQGQLLPGFLEPRRWRNGAASGQKEPLSCQHTAGYRHNARDSREFCPNAIDRC